MTFLYNNWKEKTFIDSNILPSTAMVRLLVSETCKGLYLGKQRKSSEEKGVLIRDFSN
ncbi:MAG: hypothetical protein ACXADX_03295 [Candidatus Hodarchaeales archaeon]|jgi:hypothetical protein